MRNNRLRALGLLVCLGIAYAAIMMALTLTISWREKAFATDGTPQPVTITVRRIEAFLPKEPRRQEFGALRFLGGLVLKASSRDFGSLSGLAIDQAGNRLYAVADTGFWFQAALETDDAGRIKGLADATLAPLTGKDGKPLIGKDDFDAEAISFVPASPRTKTDRILMSFERNGAIRHYILTPDYQLDWAETLKVPPSLRKVGWNKGLEAITYMQGGPLAGNTVTITEESFDAQRNIRAAVFGPSRNFPFSVRASEGFAVTDAAGLPNGDLILLERRFHLSEGVFMRLRYIEAAAIQPNAVVDGTHLMEADMSAVIDNMEGLAITNGPDGETILNIVSDDNHSFFQRTLLLQFVLMNKGERIAPAVPEGR